MPFAVASRSPELSPAFLAGDVNARSAHPAYRMLAERRLPTVVEAGTDSIDGTDLAAVLATLRSP